MLIISIMRIAAKSEAGITLVELMVTAALIVTFFTAIFEVNAVCLRYVAAGKESLAAINAANDRAETLRNLAFSDLTDTTVLSQVLAAPANGAPWSSAASEVVKLSAFPTPNGTTQLSRSASGQVTVDSTATSLGNTLVRVDVTNTFSGIGKRPRSEVVTTIISNGTKK